MCACMCVEGGGRAGGERERAEGREGEGERKGGQRVCATTLPIDQRLTRTNQEKENERKN